MSFWDSKWSQTWCEFWAPTTDQPGWAPLSQWMSRKASMGSLEPRKKPRGNDVLLEETMDETMDFQGANMMSSGRMYVNVSLKKTTKNGQFGSSCGGWESLDALHCDRCAAARKDAMFSPNQSLQLIGDWGWQFQMSEQGIITLSP